MWVLSEVDYYRAKHVALWLEGHCCRRVIGRGRSRAMTGFDKAAAKYARRNPDLK